MFFHYQKPNITLGDIYNTCHLSSNDFDESILFNSFLRSAISSPKDLTFYNNKKYSPVTNSEIIISTKKLSNNFDNKKKLLISNNIDLDIAKLSNLFYRKKNKNEILELCDFIVGLNADISDNTFINKGTVIGNDFSIEDYSSIDHSCQIGSNVKVGKNVSLSNVIIGDNVIIEDGTKIGQPGFGFTYDNNQIINIFHIGRVIIQNDVRIGANCTIDRGSFNDTVIGENTCIDNLVHIAHNVTIGNNCIIAGQCGFAGSAEIGNYVHIGGQTGVGGHIKVSDNVKIAAKSGVIRNIESGEMVMGYPAISINKYLKNYKKTMMDL